MKASFREGGSCSSGGSGSGSSTSEERRTIIVERLAGSFGFTLQSYGIHYRDEKDVEVITYVDFVDPNGPAYRAGLRTGDVILSINGQDVERANHTALVSIIQSCPSRIRMVVLFENCVRKVELHMRYIRLQTELQRKEQDYQKMCATERMLINKLGVSRRGSLNTNSMTHSATSAYGQQLHGWDNYDFGCGSVMQPRSSKSMPRCILKSSHSFIQPSSSGHEQREGSSTAERRKDHSRSGADSSSGCFKRSSYFCIGSKGGCECDSCYREEKMRRSLGGTSKTSKSHATPTVQLQRPKSCHFTSCYQAAKDDNQSVPPPPNQNCRMDLMSKSYGGYGFGYHYNVASTSNSPHHRPSQQNTPRKQCGPDYTTRTPDRRLLPKSAEDLLVAQLREQCQVRANALPSAPSIASTGSAGSSETISFYTRPPQPKPVNPTQSILRNQQRSHQERQGSTKVTRTVDDDGGFEQIRPFRTLPLAKKPM